jgi:hypothetical protein
MAMAPNVQSEACTARRYSSKPLPMTFSDLAWNPARVDSHKMAIRPDCSVA